MKRILDKKRVCVIGHFGFNKVLLNGQTVKTKIVTNELKKQFGDEEVLTIDTHGGGKRMLKLAFQLPLTMNLVKNIIMMPAHNGVRFFSPLLFFYRKFSPVKLHYVVIGGWLPDFLKDKKLLRLILKKFDGVYVETSTMKKSLDSLGFTNVYILPNCKELSILKEDELIYSISKPFRLCTFSRVMKEKGIADAVEVVKKINEKYDESIFKLDIYGQIDPLQVEWFDELKCEFSKDIEYKGVVSFDQSVDVLKKYDALLFPTKFYTEGIPGTIIDAYASGLPVICSKWESWNDIVNESITGYTFEFCDNESFENLLLFLSENPELLVSMKKKCLEKAYQYSTEKVINKFITYLT